MGCRIQFFFHIYCQLPPLSPNAKVQVQTSAPASHSPCCLCLTSAFPSPSRCIAFLLCCLALIDAVICVLRQPEPINPSKHPIIKKGSHLQLWGGEKGSLCFCLLAVLRQAVSLGARDNARMSGVMRSVSRLNASRGILRAAEISKAVACRSGDFYSCNVGAGDGHFGLSGDSSLQSSSGWWHQPMAPLLPPYLWPRVKMGVKLEALLSKCQAWLLEPVAVFFAGGDTETLWARQALSRTDERLLSPLLPGPGAPFPQGKAGVGQPDYRDICEKNHPCTDWQYWLPTPHHLQKNNTEVNVYLYAQLN